jgi:hypothetical protein
MNNSQIQNGQDIVIDSDWGVRAKGLQEQYPLLSDNDLHFEEGKENELLCRIETRLNKSRVEVISILQKNVIVVELPSQNL